jgi:DNA-binding NarL/FixJ family response regulator
MTEPANKITMLVVADPDHAAVEHIRSLVALEPDLEVVATASRRDDVAELLRELEPDVAVIDVNLLSHCDHPLHGWGPIDRRIRLVAVGWGEDPCVTSRLHAAGFDTYISAERLDEEMSDMLRRPAPDELTTR